MKVTLTVDSRVRLPTAGVQPEVLADLRADFVYANPQWAKLRAMGYAARGEPREYRTSVLTPGRPGVPGEVSFPRGGYGRVRDLLRAAGYAVSVVDARCLGAPMADLAPGKCPAEIPAHRFEMRDYQREAIEAIAAKQNCILRAPTGAGKTCCGFGLAAHLRVVPTLVVVWSGALYAQWLKRVPLELGLDKRHVGTIRGGKVRLRPLTIAMQQSLFAILEKGGQQADEIKEAFGCVILDECQKAAAKTVFGAIDPLPAKYRVAISADHTRKDKREFLIYDLFGPKPEGPLDVKQDRLVEAGHVLDVEVRVVPSSFQFYAPTGKDDDYNAFLEALTEDAARNALVMQVVKTEHARGEQVLVFTARREHALKVDSMMTAAGIRSGALLGGADNEEVFQATIRGLEDGTVRGAAGTVQAVGQGVDLPKLAVGVLATPMATNRQQFCQVRGRLCRPGKESARLYYVWDRSLGKEHVANLVKWNRRVVVLEGRAWVEGREWLSRVSEPFYGGPRVVQGA